jgi:dihydropteroate synthase
MTRPDLARRIAGASAMPLIMGILNVTPDSFSDGGRFDDVSRALDHAREMAADGCDLLDLGGESTRPGATPVSAEEEAARVLPVLRALVAALDVPVSVDTSKASVARAALEAGAAIINDIWGLQGDPDMAAVVAAGNAWVVVMHNRHDIDPACDIVADMRRFFDRTLEIADRAGVARDRIILDPGIGFGKTPTQNLHCIAHLDDLSGYGLPILLGVSRKSFIGHVLGRDVGARLCGTLAAGLAGVARGASILRVHDVAAHVDAVRMTAAIAESAS